LRSSNCRRKHQIVLGKDNLIGEDDGNLYKNRSGGGGNARVGDLAVHEEDLLCYDEKEG